MAFPTVVSSERSSKRRALFRMLASACFVVSSLISAATQAEPPGSSSNYPSRPIRIVVGFVPGGGVDIVMRVFAQQLSQSWGTSIVVENRPGAASAIAMGAVANATPDGYTILGGTASMIYSTAFGKVPYDILKVYIPVVKLSSQSYLLLLSPTLPASSVRELIAYAKERPQGITYASSGVGSPSHIGMELFKWMAGVPATHVPYKGIPQALADMISGQISMSFGLLISAAPQVKSGKLKAIAVTAQRRSDLFPNIPTMSEAGVPKFELTGEYGLYVPARTPMNIVAMLNRESNRIIGTSAMKERLAADGADAAQPNTPAEYRESLTRTIELCKTFIAKSGFRID